MVRFIFHPLGLKGKDMTPQEILKRYQKRKWMQPGFVGPVRIISVVVDRSSKNKRYLEVIFQNVNEQILLQRFYFTTASRKWLAMLYDAMSYTKDITKKEWNSEAFHHDVLMNQMVKITVVGKDWNGKVWLDVEEYALLSADEMRKALQRFNQIDSVNEESI